MHYHPLHSSTIHHQLIACPSTLLFSHSLLLRPLWSSADQPQCSITSPGPVPFGRSALLPTLVRRYLETRSPSSTLGHHLMSQIRQKPPQSIANPTKSAIARHPFMLPLSCYGSCWLQLATWRCSTFSSATTCKNDRRLGHANADHHLPIACNQRYIQIIEPLESPTYWLLMTCQPILCHLPRIKANRRSSTREHLLVKYVS